MGLKALEGLVRTNAMRRFDRPFAGVLVTEPRDVLRLPAAGKVLFLQKDKLGDVLVSLPVVRAIRRHYPGVQLHYLLLKGNYVLRPGIEPLVDRVWRYRRSVGDVIRLLPAFRRERFDVIVDLRHSASVTAGHTIRLAGCRHSVGLMKENASAYTHCVPKLAETEVGHMVELYAQLLLPFGIDPSAEALDLEYAVSPAAAARARSLLPAEPGRRRLGVNISGAGLERYWGRDNFIAFVRWVQTHHPDFDITICGGPGYAEEIAAIVAATGAGTVPALRFEDFAAVISEFDVVVSPDTSVVHIAAAARRPILSLHHAPEGVMPWRPRGTFHRSLGHRDALARIPVGQVCEAFDSLMHECAPCR